ncbi:MAG: CsbD-like protein [Methanocella sp. PtaU1.Bin125]|nr:MAG: CsbD-like protein [Methanocella sp. PtaU1.Bin125]
MGGRKKQVEGAGRAAMGKAQEEAGKAIGDPGMEMRGREKSVAGQAGMNPGKARKKVKKKKDEERKRQ